MKKHRQISNGVKGSYVDGFVFPIQKNKVAAYKKMAAWGKRVWMKHGALAYYECMGDDLKIKPDPSGMSARSFVEAANAKPGDTVWFSFIVFKDKKHRDAVNKKVMAQMEKESAKWESVPMPMDPKKMAYGGFRAVVRG